MRQVKANNNAAGNKVAPTKTDNNVGNMKPVKPGKNLPEEGTEFENEPIAETDPVFIQYGPPFLVSGEKVVLNERAVAIKCAEMHTVRYDSGTKKYERFDKIRGLWVLASEVAVMKLLDELLIELGKAYDQDKTVTFIGASKLASLCKMMKPNNVNVELQETVGLVHASNGVIALTAGNAKLMVHDPKYQFRATSGIKFDAKAQCPQFRKKFLGSALAPADAQLVQKYCGSMLLGPNTCHGMLIVRGTPGGGKSTLITIVEKIIGESNVAYLRTSHLGGRFETSAFLGKRLLVGKDVPGDTLAVNGARMLKSLVGNDLMQAEIKYNPDKKVLRGDYHVIIVSNNNLRIALDGDYEAWQRRLLVVDFKNPKPSKPIPSYAEKLVAAEGSGILNWLIDGAIAYRIEMEKHGHLSLSNDQRERIKTLLEDSDNVKEFVNQTIKPAQGGDVTCEELLLCYYRKCESQQWTPVAQQAFFTRVPDLLGHKFKAARRNDIKREGKAVRGFKNVALV